MRSMWYLFYNKKALRYLPVGCRNDSAFFDFFVFFVFPFVFFSIVFRYDCLSLLISGRLLF